MPRSAPWFLVVLLLASVFLLRETQRSDSPLATLDERFLDWLMANTSTSAAQQAALAQPAVTLVEIDDAALDPGAGKEAMTALDYALILQAAAAFDPAVVAIAPVLEFPRPQPEYERILLDQALRTPKLLLAARPNGHAPGRVPPPAITPETVVAPLRHVRGDRRRLPELRELDRRPAESLLLAAAACGPTVVDLDAEVPSFAAFGAPSPAPSATAAPAAAAGPGSSARTVPLLFRTPTGQVLPAFTLQAAMLWLQLTADEIKVELPTHVQLGGRWRVPIDATGALRLDFRSLRAVPRLGIDDLILAANEKNAGAGRAGGVTAPPAALARVPGGVLLLGRTDQTTRTLSLPVGGSGDARGAPAELLALAIANLQAHAFIRRAPLAADLLIVAALCALGWRLLALRRLPALLLLVAALLVYTLLALVVFDLARLWLPWALPAGAIGVAALLLAFLPHPAPAPAVATPR